MYIILKNLLYLFNRDLFYVAHMADENKIKIQGKNALFLELSTSTSEELKNTAASEKEAAHQ